MREIGNGEWGMGKAGSCHYLDFRKPVCLVLRCSLFALDYSLFPIPHSQP